MLLRILRALARPALTPSGKRKPSVFGCSCGLVLLVAVGLGFAVLLAKCLPVDSVDVTVADEKEADAAPRLLLSRVWFDKLPEKRTDPIDIWIFFGGGIGLHETGSSYRFVFDLFEFERQGSKIDARYLHDKKRFKTGFQVRKCDDHQPFDLCLTLQEIDGKKVELYGFGYDDDMERAVPGSRATLEAAKVRAAAGKGTEASD